MESIKISPIAISKILDMELDDVIYKITGEKASIGQKQDDYEKQVKSIRKKYKSELFELSKLPLFIDKNAVSDDLQNVCILREFISQYDKNPKYLMRKMSEDKKCVEQIDFVGSYKYHKMIISDSLCNLITLKLAEMHLSKYGDTDRYKLFWQGRVN